MNQAAAIAACLHGAKRDPIRLAELLMAARGEAVHRHPMHAMMMDLLVLCRDDIRNIAIHAPPEHGKTAVVLPFLVDSLGRDPNRRIGLVASDSDLVGKSMTVIRKALLSPIVGSVWPNLHPDVQRSHTAHGGWSQGKLYLEGQSWPAFEAFPLLGAAEGHRLDIIYLDDACGKSGLRSAAERERTYDAVFGTYLNRLTAHGVVVWTNNCWHRDDAFHKARNSPAFCTLWIAYDGAERLAFQIGNPPETYTGPLSGDFPLWSQWPLARIAQKQEESPIFFTRLYEGRAVQAEECRFPQAREWARYEPEEIPAAITKGANLYGHLDPSGGKSAYKNDFAAAMGLLKLNDKTVYLTDAWVQRRAPSQQMVAMFDMERQWRRKYGIGFRMFHVELAPNAEGWIRPALEQVAKKLRQAGDPAWALLWEACFPREAKEARIERIHPFLVNGWLRFPADLEARMAISGALGDSWREVVRQMEDWPNGEYDDAPDALAGALDLAFPPGMPEKQVTTFDAIEDMGGVLGGSWRN